VHFCNSGKCLEIDISVLAEKWLKCVQQYVLLEIRRKKSGYFGTNQVKYTLVHSKVNVKDEYV
jgi:hypothetical protein